MGKIMRGIAVIALLFVSLPTFVVLISSFSLSPSLQFPPTGISFQAYMGLLGDDFLRSALSRSLLIGLQSVVLALLVGVPAGLALFRYRTRYAGAISAYLMLGFSTPLVVSGIAFLVLYLPARLIGKIWPLAVALTIVNLPFLLWSLASAVSGLSNDLEDAAATLGAERFQTFLFVTLPSIMPGILTGALLVFVLGMTEFLVSLILTTTANATLPVRIFGSLRGALSPVLAAAGGVYILIALVIILVITRVRSLGQFLYRND